MFTSNQIEEIRKKLQLQGRKDTSFPVAGPLQGNEILPIIQQGQNAQLGLKTFIEKVGMYTMSDFINLSKYSEDSYTLEDVIKLVDPVNRKAGQVITFMDSTTKGWAIYQFTGNSADKWFNLDLWDNILAKVDNHFKGWYANECLLKTYCVRPHVGDFAFVGETMEDSILYGCIKYGEWYNTGCRALEYANKYEAVHSKDFNEIDVNLDEVYADRANKDALGNIIHDTYLSRADFISDSSSIDERLYRDIVFRAAENHLILLEPLDVVAKILESGEDSIKTLADSLVEITPGFMDILKKASYSWMIEKLNTLLGAELTEEDIEEAFGGFPSFFLIAAIYDFIPVKLGTCLGFDQLGGGVKDMEMRVAMIRVLGYFYIININWVELEKSALLDPNTYDPKYILHKDEDGNYGWAAVEDV